MPNPMAATKAKVKPVTSRLAKSKNFWKLDRSLDDYIDRTSLIKSGPKRLLRKLLLLRGREDANEVKVTVSGLRTLLSVNIKTIRVWLKSLEQAGFIYYQGEVWDAHCNYPKKKYVFPVTFPGFDSATVFIQKGAKAKYKQRMADPVKAKVKRKKVARLSAPKTCPVKDGLPDCSPLINQRETQTLKEDTNVSSFKSLVGETSSAAPRTFSMRLFHRSHAKVLSYSPTLKALINNYLRSKGQSGKLQWVSNFIEQECRANCTLETRYDKAGLARDLEQVLPLFIADRRRSSHRLGALFRFLREYIAEYIGDTVLNNEWHNEFRYQAAWRDFNDRKRFFREFPFCKEPEEPVYPPAGVNRY